MFQQLLSFQMKTPIKDDMTNLVNTAMSKYLTVGGKLSKTIDCVQLSKTIDCAQFNKKLIT